MAHSHLFPYPNFSPAPNTQPLNFITTDSVVYVSVSGNDTTGDGSLATPYRTLSRAMQHARQYTIFGNAILYIRLLRGEHTVAQAVDLYHPQGGNIVIEGDPSAFNQKTLFSVESYTWVPNQFGGGGHRGRLRLFDGLANPNQGGATLHGFTGVDNGLYFSITNAAIGSRDGYRTSIQDGINSGLTASYDFVFHGDRFYNHGYSYEDGEGILGVGRIRAGGATLSAETLDVFFNNFNIDTRVPALQNGGGVDNNLQWGSSTLNYPETQYSQPNGYYGNPNWKNNAGTVFFPSKANLPTPNVSTITEDPYVLSTYPVVIRAKYGQNLGTLFLKNGSIRAIRNIFFANSESPYTVNGITGATQNFSYGFSVVSDQLIPECSNGTALYFENATVGLRHLGFYGTGTAIASYGSRIYAYYDQTGYTNDAAITSLRGMVHYATQGNLDNAPVVCTAQCRNGIVAKNSTIDFSNSSGISSINGTDYRHNGSFISTTGRCLELTSTNLRANSLHLDSTTDIPKFIATFLVPIFPGNTHTGPLFVGDAIHGRSASFAGFSESTSFWNVFPRAQVFFQHPNRGNVAGNPPNTLEHLIGVVNYIVDAGSIGTISDTNNNYFGLTSSATVSFGALPGTVVSQVLNPVDYRKIIMYGVKFSATTPSDNANPAVRLVGTREFRTGITGTFVTSESTSRAGRTLSVRFSPNNTSGVSASITIGENVVCIQGFNGITTSLLQLRNNGLGVCAAPLFLEDWRSFGGNDPRVYMNSSANALFASEKSSVVIEKSLNITNGGYYPVDVRDNSSINIGDLATSETLGNASPTNSQTRNTTLGALSVRGYSKSALRLSNGSDGRVGVIFAKHPLHGDPEIVNSRNASITTVHAQNNSRLTVGAVYALGVFGRAVGSPHVSLWAGMYGGLSYGNYHFSGQGFLRADASRIIVIGGSGGAGESIFSLDGGTASLQFRTTNGAKQVDPDTDVRYSIPVVASGGEIVFGPGCVIGGGGSVTTTTTNDGSGTFVPGSS